MACTMLGAQERRERNLLEFGTLEAAAKKQCRTCKRVLPVSSSFHRSDSLKGGYTSSCKDCCKKATAANNANRNARFGGRPPGPPPGDKRRCTACDETKPFSEFYIERNTSGLMPICKKCHIAAVQCRYRKTLASSASLTGPGPGSVVM